MDDFEVRQIMNDLNFEVRNFKKNRNGNQWAWSCLVCGDSQMNSRKARFGVAKKNGVWVCNCFNCGYSNTFMGYLKDYHTNLYDRATVNSFLQMNPEMFILDHLFENKVSNKTLTSVFFINKFSNPKYWLDYLLTKKIKLKEKNIKTLYRMHKEYWNERSMD